MPVLDCLIALSQAKEQATSDIDGAKDVLNLNLEAALASMRGEVQMTSSTLVKQVKQLTTLVNSETVALTTRFDEQYSDLRQWAIDATGAVSDPLDLTTILFCLLLIACCR